LINVFTPYERFQKDKPGAGLGLSICKRIIEGHQEKIWISSKYVKGTEFIISLLKYDK
jgi:two-component system sensor histidine kinase KdpD